MGMAAASGTTWKASVAGMPCTIERTDESEWVVTIASATLGRSYNLADAICDAAGGLVSRRAAEAIAAAVEEQRSGQTSPDAGPRVEPLDGGSTQLRPGVPA